MEFSQISGDCLHKAQDKRFANITIVIPDIAVISFFVDLILPDLPIDNGHILLMPTIIDKEHDRPKEISIVDLPHPLDKLLKQDNKHPNQKRRPASPHPWQCGPQYRNKSNIKLNKLYDNCKILQRE